MATELENGRGIVRAADFFDAEHHPDIGFDSRVG